MLQPDLLRTPAPLADLARRAVFGVPQADWPFVEAGTLAWQQWTSFCLHQIGKAPVAAHVLATPPGRPMGRYRGRSLPMGRPPGARTLDRMRIASGEREGE